MALARLLLVMLVVAVLVAPALQRSGGKSECEDREHRKHTLKLVKEMPFSGLFHDLKGQTKFEASGVVRVHGKMYVVFDSSMSIGLLGGTHFDFRDSANRLIGEWEKESQFEGIAYVPENNTFLLLQEAIGDGDTYKPWITTAKLHDDLQAYDVLQECVVDFELSHENKGFESIQYVSQGEYLLGLCEGNFCSGGQRGKTPGNGRIVVSKLDEADDGSCRWVPERTIDVPSEVAFTDYSAMAFNYQLSKLAILSQEDAAVWVGDFDIDTLEFGEDPGQIFHLPRDNHCETIYCNAEGIQWIDNYRLLVASDKAKSRQPYHCDAKGESIHIFSLPPVWQPEPDGAAANKREPEPPLAEL